MKNLKQKKIELSYNELSKIEYQLQELDIKITNKEFKENVILTIQATKEKLERADVKL
jgi:putative IMPACT (imprinted ancient) family translation regulator